MERRNEHWNDVINNLRKAVEKAGSEEILKQRERESRIAAAADEIIKNTSVTEEPERIFVKATDPVWDRPVRLRGSLRRKNTFRPAGDREFEVPLIQRIVKDIRDAVGDPDKVEKIVYEVAGGEGLTDESKKFLLGLLARVKRVPMAPEEAHKLSEKRFEEAMQEWRELTNRGKETAKRVRDIRATDAAVKREDAKLSAQIQDLSDKLDELNKRRAEFLSKPKIYIPETGELKLLDAEELSKINFQNADGGELHLFGGVSAKHEEGTISLTPEVKKEVDEIRVKSGSCAYGTTNSTRFRVNGPWKPDYPKDGEKLKNKLDPVEALVRAGFTKEQAERKVQEGKSKKSWKKIPILMETEVEGEVEVPELKTQPVELPKEPEIKRDLKYYDERDRLKREKAQRALQEGGGWIRRSYNGAKRVIKTLPEVEGQFIKAIDDFEKKYGISVSTIESESDDRRGIPGHQTKRIARAGRRFKHMAGLIPSQEITDTEIMAATTISDAIKLPNNGKLSDMWIACPKRNEKEAEKPVVKESAKRPDEEKKDEEKKVEKRVSIIVKVRRAVARKLISSAVRLAGRIYDPQASQTR